VANLLRVLDDPTDVAALAGWLRSPHVGLSDNAIVAMGLHEQGFAGAWNDAAWAAPAADAPTLERARRLLPRLRQIAWQEPLPRALPGLYAELSLFPVLLAQPDGQVAVANLEKLAAKAGQFAGQGRHQFPDLLRWLTVAMELEVREGVAATAEEGGNTVRILTVHKSKGLEFPVVVLPDLGRSPRYDVPEVLLHPAVGLAPRLTDDEGEEVRSGLRDLAIDLDRQESEQEFRRLFYVAATRARDYLICAASQPRVGASGEAKPRATWLHWLFEACGADLAAPPATLTCGQISLPVRTAAPLAAAELRTAVREVAAVRLTPPAIVQVACPSAAVAELLRRTASLVGSGQPGSWRPAPAA
jgi:ATP-dependent helicase/nuclease subunit A